MDGRDGDQKESFEEKTTKFDKSPHFVFDTSVLRFAIFAGKAPSCKRFPVSSGELFKDLTYCGVLQLRLRESHPTARSRRSLTLGKGLVGDGESICSPGSDSSVGWRFVGWRFVVRLASRWSAADERAVGYGASSRHEALCRDHSGNGRAV